MIMLKISKSNDVLLFHLYSKVILLGHYNVQMNFYIKTLLTSTCKFTLFVNFINDTEVNKYQTK